MSRPARPFDARKADRLRAVAAAAFAERGLDGASLNAILESAGLGKGSFYHHFDGKAALHDWVTEALASALVTEIRPPQLATLTAATFQAELIGLLDRAGRTATTRPELMELGRMFHNSVDVPDERAIARVRGAVIGWVATALVTGRNLGVIRTDLPIDLLTAWAIASLTAVDQWMLAAPPSDTSRTAAETAVGALWQVLSVPSRPS